MFDVVTQGLCAIDWLLQAPCFPERDQKLALDDFRRYPGGQAASVAAALSKWGLNTAFLGAFGGDEPGDFCREALVRAGVEVSSCQRVRDSASQQAFIIVDPDGGRTILWRRPPQLEQKHFELPKTRWLHLDGHDLEAAHSLAHQARRRDLPISLDLEGAGEEHLQLASLCRVVLCDQSTGRELTGEKEPAAVARALAGRLGAPIVGVSWGAKGLYGRYRGQNLHAVHRLETVVDTTGAGDLCNAGMVYALLEGRSVEQAFQLAALCGALVCRKLGVFPAIPEPQELLSA